MTEIRTRNKQGVSPLSFKDKKIASEFVKAYADKIVDKCVNFFIKKKRVVCTNVKKKL